MRKYKKLYIQETTKNAELKMQIDELEKQIKEKNVEPYTVDVHFDEESHEHINNVINHKTNYRGYPDCRAESWIITTADGVVSVFKYDEVKYILAYR